MGCPLTDPWGEVWGDNKDECFLLSMILFTLLLNENWSFVNLDKKFFPEYFVKYASEKQTKQKQ